MNYLSPRIFAIISVIFIFCYTSCKKEVELKPDQSINDYFKLKGKVSSLNTTKGEAFNSINLLGGTKIIAGKILNKATCKSSEIDWQDWTCATVTHEIGDDGCSILTFDYGENGCNEWGEFISGKISLIWKEEGNRFYTKAVFDNFFCQDIYLNGYSEVTLNIAESDEENYQLSGTSTCTEEIIMVFKDNEEYLYSAQYSDKISGSSYEISEGNFSYKNLKDNSEYKSTIEETLLSDYKCLTSFIPQSGAENVQYIVGENIEEFRINYGNGECDNKVMITENGNSYEVDFGEYKNTGIAF